MNTRATVLLVTQLALGRWRDRGLTIDELQDRVPANPHQLVGAVRDLQDAGHADVSDSGRVTLTAAGLVHWWSFLAEYSAIQRDRASAHLVRCQEGAKSTAARLRGDGSRAAAEACTDDSTTVGATTR